MLHSALEFVLDGSQFGSQIRNSDLKLLLDGPASFAFAGRGSAFEDKELLLFGGDLQNEISHTLLEVLLRSLSSDKRFPRRRVIGRLPERVRGKVNDHKNVLKASRE